MTVLWIYIHINH